MKISTDFNTLPDLAKLLATDGWVIYEYKAIASNSVNLTIYQKEKEEGDRESEA
jgi:hypothetical protein